MIVVLLAACDQGRSTPAPKPPAPPQPPAPPPDARLRSCTDIEPEYQATRQAQRDAFGAELRRRGLSSAALDQTPAPRGVDLPKLSGGAVAEVAAAGPRGKARRYLVADDHFYDGVQRSLLIVTDGKGSVWYVREELRPTTKTTVAVEACPWGCFGIAPSGVEPGPAEAGGRRVLALTAGQVFKGPLVVEYAAPVIELQTTFRECELPE